MSASFARRVLALACALAASGCATLASERTGGSFATDHCTRWFATLDAAVDAAGVGDAQDERIAGFPGLRVDRLAQALREREPFAAWLARAAALDRDALTAESANLPPAAFPIDGAADARAVRERSAACRDAWPARLAADDAARRTLLARATVPDRYATPLRAIGLYPIARWPFFAGVQAWQQAHTAAVARWSERPPPSLRFAPADDDPHAPVFEIESRDGGASLAPHDRFGAPFWPARDADAPQVDVARPVVYRRIAHALDDDGRLLEQRLYTLWFPERPADGPFDLLAGALDGVIVRVTLARDGSPLGLDTIHACGCWHQFFPRADLALRDDPTAHEEWAFVPARLPAVPRGQRVVVRLASRTHHVMALAASDDRTLPVAARYALADEQALRSLPVRGDAAARRSLYGPDGLVAASRRAERFLFWPMGIASAGAMRQWGHHATAFVGRRHFDDPNLWPRRIVAPSTPPP